MISRPRGESAREMTEHRGSGSEPGSNCVRDVDGGHFCPNGVLIVTGYTAYCDD
jgi:hypothetical protein